MQKPRGFITLHLLNSYLFRIRIVFERVVLLFTVAVFIRVAMDPESVQTSVRRVTVVGMDSKFNKSKV